MDIQKEREAFEAWVIENLADGRSMSWEDWCWKSWQVATAQAVPEAITIGNELQSWVAVNSFSADDGEGVLPVVDANAIAEKIEELTGAKS